MTLPEHDLQSIEVLALLADPKPMQALLTALRLEGVHVDAVDDLQTARSKFFSSGGHGCLIIGPDVPPGVANKVAHSLDAIDPELAMATFGPQLNDRSVLRTAKLAGFHPSSRAGLGALLRFLRSL
ncbi:MAG: hypothetical protein ACI91B_001228 [Planctomycetota bacterium]|jgi:hypothetical protein